MERRENICAVIHKVLFVISLIFAVCIAIYNTLNSTPYYVFLSVCIIPMMTIPHFIYQVLHLRPVPSLTLFFYIFIFFAYIVGMVFYGFTLIPLFDKLVHLLSGVLFGLLGLDVFYLMKDERIIKKEDCLGAFYHCISFAALSAVVWEMYEYFINFALHNDPQRVLLTGVNDTMQDMIACLIGAGLFSISILIFFKKGKKSFLLGSFLSFYHLNIEKRDS